MIFFYTGVDGYGRIFICYCGGGISATIDLATYQVKVEGDKILVGVPSE